MVSPSPHPYPIVTLEPLRLCYTLVCWILRKKNSGGVFMTKPKRCRCNTAQLLLKHIMRVLYITQSIYCRFAVGTLYF